MLFLSGEITSNAALSRRLKVKPHTVAAWRREEDWDGLQLRADRRAAEKLVEELATDRAELNTRHFKLWEALLSRAVQLLKDSGGQTVAGLERIASILERAQRGQRVAKEIATAAEAAEAARLQAAADLRAFVDLFISSVKEHVRDEETRERLRLAILDGLPTGSLEGAGESSNSSVQ